MSALTDFHFLRPLWFIAILPWVLSLFWIWRQQSKNQSPWSEWIDPHLLNHVLIQPRESAQPNKPLATKQLASKRLARLRLNQIGGLLVSLLTIIALAGPTWKQYPSPVIKQSDALVLVLDLSLSMNAEDLKPSRLDRARHKIQDILAMKKGSQFGLITYSGEAHIVTPLTDDAATINAMLPALTPLIMPVIGSAPYSGITEATKLLKQANRQQGRILLITDGIRATDINPIAKHLNATNYSLSVLGVGTPQGAPIPLPNGTFIKDQQGQTVLPKLTTALLQELTQSTQGYYAPLMASDRDITQLLPPQTPFNVNAPSDTLPERQFDQWEDMGPWLVLFTLPWVAWQFRKGLLCALPLTLLSLLSLTMPQPLQAAENPFSLWDRLWKRSDQLAQEAYETQEYSKAERGFSSPERKALAAYHQQNYDQALEYFDELAALDEIAALDKTTTLYNKGNTLAQARQFEQALAAYEAVLEKDPEHAAALHNKQLIESLLQQQEQQQGQEQEQQGQDSQQSQDAQQSQNSQDNQHSQQQSQQQSQDSQQSQASQADNSEDTSTSEDENKTGEENGEENDDQETKEAAQAIRQSEDPSSQEQQALEQQALEKQQALQQWLEQVPDDPSGLLRRKFLLESQQRDRQTSGQRQLNRRQSEPFW